MDHVEYSVVGVRNYQNCSCMMGLPRRNGKLKDLSKFDATFFGVHPKQAECMDPQIRNLLEVSYEALVDAGVCPLKIRGSNTGVLIGVQQPDKLSIGADIGETAPYQLTGSAMSMFPNRLSFFYDFKGPSLAVDTACSSFIYALNLAVTAIRSGQCDAALVGGSNTCLDPDISLKFLHLGVLSPEGKCKSFDKDANGYVRSEGISIFYLQKRIDAKRIYCTVVHTKTNSDGNKVQGITFPSSEVQGELLRSTYKEAGVNPRDVAYVEAHATGTSVGDPQESGAITSVFCEGRSNPLLIGSVKSNMGHCESGAGGAALAKVIVAMETNIIPANLHYNTPNKHIPGLINGHLQVVNRNTPWKGGTVGVNSFGFGGANAHAILQSCNTERQTLADCRKTRLVNYGARTAQGAETVLKEARKHSTDLNFHHLLSETANMPVSTHPYRGFTVVNGGSDTIHIQKTTEERRPVWFVFAGMGSQWQGMGRGMMNIEVFQNSIKKSDATLKPHGISLYNIIMDGEDATDDIIKSFVGITSIQVALIDVLTCIGIVPDGIVGHSVGELACGYADGSLTSEEAVLAAYWRGYCVKNANLPVGAMAAVGLTWHEAIKQCPPGVVPACHNAEESVTVSGPEEAVEKFVKELQEKGIFARLVKSAGVAFHSYFMTRVEETLRNALSEVIVPKPRTSRWISSSFQESRWSVDAAKMSSADYHVHNLVSPVLFQEALSHVPSNAVVIEVAPHCLLQSVLKGSLSSKCCIVGLMKRNLPDNVEFCMTALGKCYQNGVNMDILNLFPPVPMPVPRGTPMISPLIKWDHSQTWTGPKKMEDNHEGTSFTIDLSTNSEFQYLLDHKIYGRSIMPASGFYILAWKALAKREGKQWDQMPIIMEDIMIHRPVILTPDTKVQIDVSFIPGSDKFQVLERDEVVMEGKIGVLDEKVGKVLFSDFDRDLDPELVLNTADLYKDFSLKGYEYGPSFRLVSGGNISGTYGKLRWTHDWIKFIDAVTHLSIVPAHDLYLPNRITILVIDPLLHYQLVENMTGRGEEALDVFLDFNLSSRHSGGVHLQGVSSQYVQRTEKKSPIHESFKFVPNVKIVSAESELHRYADVIMESLKQTGVNSDEEDPNPETAGTFPGGQDTNQNDIENVSPESKETFPDGQTHSFLRVLKEINQKLNEENTAEFLKELTNTEDLSSDILLSNLLQPKFLRPCLEVALENTHSRI